LKKAFNVFDAVYGATTSEDKEWTYATNEVIERGALSFFAQSTTEKRCPDIINHYSTTEKAWEQASSDQDNIMHSAEKVTGAQEDEEELGFACREGDDFYLFSYEGLDLDKPGVALELRESVCKAAAEVMWFLTTTGFRDAYFEWCHLITRQDDGLKLVNYEDVLVDVFVKKLRPLYNEQDVRPTTT